MNNIKKNKLVESRWLAMHSWRPFCAD